MITENQSKAVNEEESQLNFSPYQRHGTTAGILLQNDCYVTTRSGKILPAKSD